MRLKSVGHGMHVKQLLYCQDEDPGGLAAFPDLQGTDAAHFVDIQIEVDHMPATVHAYHNFR